MTGQQLIQLLRTQVIPWAQTRATNRFIVGQKEMSKAELPEGVILTPRKIAGKRGALKTSASMATRWRCIRSLPAKKQSAPPVNYSMVTGVFMMIDIAAKIGNILRAAFYEVKHSRHEVSSE